MDSTAAANFHAQPLDLKLRYVLLLLSKLNTIDIDCESQNLSTLKVPINELSYLVTAHNVTVLFEDSATHDKALKALRTPFIRQLLLAMMCFGEHTEQCAQIRMYLDDIYLTMDTNQRCPEFMYLRHVLDTIYAADLIHALKFAVDPQFEHELRDEYAKDTTIPRMWLSNMVEKLENGEYMTKEAFAADLKKIGGDYIDAFQCTITEEYRDVETGVSINTGPINTCDFAKFLQRKAMEVTSYSAYIHSANVATLDNGPNVYTDTPIESLNVDVPTLRVTPNIMFKKTGFSDPQSPFWSITPYTKGNNPYTMFIRERMNQFREYLKKSGQQHNDEDYRRMLLECARSKRIKMANSDTRTLTAIGDLMEEDDNARVLMEHETLLEEWEKFNNSLFFEMRERHRAMHPGFASKSPRQEIDLSMVELRITNSVEFIAYWGQYELFSKDEVIEMFLEEYYDARNPMSSTQFSKRDSLYNYYHTVDTEYQDGPSGLVREMASKALEEYNELITTGTNIHFTDHDLVGDVWYVVDLIASLFYHIKLESTNNTLKELYKNLTEILDTYYNSTRDLAFDDESDTGNVDDSSPSNEKTSTEAITVLVFDALLCNNNNKNAMSTGVGGGKGAATNSSAADVVDALDEIITYVIDARHPVLRVIRNLGQQYKDLDKESVYATPVAASSISHRLESVHLSHNHTVATERVMVVQGNPQ